MTTNGHVVRSANERLGLTVDQLARHAQITKLDLALLRDDNVGRLDVSMDDLAVVQVHQTVQDRFRDFTQYLFARPTVALLDLLVDLVQRATFAVLHNNRYRHV